MSASAVLEPPVGVQVAGLGLAHRPGDAGDATRRIVTPSRLVDREERGLERQLLGGREGRSLATMPSGIMTMTPSAIVQWNALVTAP